MIIYIHIYIYLLIYLITNQLLIYISYGLYHYYCGTIIGLIQDFDLKNNNNNNNWDDLYSAVCMGITKNKGTVTYKLIVIRLSKQKGLEVCFKAVYCR